LELNSTVHSENLGVMLVGIKIGNFKNIDFF